MSPSNTSVADTPLRSAPFRWLTAASTVDQLGSAIAPVALAFAVLDLTGSVTDLGIVVGSRSIANILFLLLGGVVADRLPKSWVLVGSCTAAALTQAAVAALIWHRVDSVLLLAGLSAANGMVNAFAYPASSSLIPQTVAAEQLVPANAIARVASNSAMVLGAASAGVVVATIGPAWGIGIDAATFALAAGLFAFVRGSTASPTAAAASVWSDLVAGWHAVVSRTWIWVVVVAFTAINVVFAGSQLVLGPVVADETIGRSGWGVVLAAQGLGYVAGGLIASRLRLRHLLRYGMACMALESSLAFALGLRPTLAVLLIASFVGGVGTEQFAVAWYASLHRHVPPELLARVSSYDMLGSIIAIPLGEMLAGPLSQLVGLRATLVGGGVVVLLATAAATATRSVRDLVSEPSGA